MIVTVLSKGLSRVITQIIFGKRIRYLIVLRRYNIPFNVYETMESWYNFSTFMISWDSMFCIQFVLWRNEIMYRLPTVLILECTFDTFHMKNLLCIQHIFVRKSWSLYVIIMRHNTFNHLVTRNIMKPIDKIKIFSRIEWLEHSFSYVILFLRNCIYLKTCVNIAIKIIDTKTFYRKCIFSNSARTTFWIPSHNRIY